MRRGSACVVLLCLLGVARGGPQTVTNDAPGSHRGYATELRYWHELHGGAFATNSSGDVDTSGVYLCRDTPRYGWHFEWLAATPAPTFADLRAISSEAHASEAAQRAAAAWQRLSPDVRAVIAALVRALNAKAPPGQTITLAEVVDELRSGSQSPPRTGTR